ncbi:MAG: Asp-tRNA(Asn)/Glu-tRNA(Gln) amidotransferase subunit GatA [Roseburia sp.]|nr:Asp-tRNA(Asn)/Glu-tRNA(Gln) amidotransferase subunit GatA [Roseburia sp.]
MDISDMSLTELARALDGKKISSVEATQACLDRIEATAELNNFITVCRDGALDAAREADRRRSAGEKCGALCGVPVAVKDNIVTRGVKTTCASKFLQNFVPPYDAAVVERLKADGAVIVGKTNLDEFAMGSTNENSAFGAVKNAVDTSRVSGGSSGGSANCVASKQVFGALGSDTGGSIRQPASYCGVVGLKPTYSAVSRYGLIAFASSLDQIGTLTRTCDDALAMLRVIAGRDDRDTTSAPTHALAESLNSDVRGKTIGIADEFFDTDKLDGGVCARCTVAAEELKKRGAKIKRVSIKSFDAALAVYYVLSSAEASSNLARFDGVKYGMRASKYADIADMYTKSRSEYFGAEVKRRIMTGNYVLSSGYYDAYYLKAMKIRTIIKSEFESALSECDALLCPTAPTVAPHLGEQNDPHRTYLSDMYTVPVNISGLPAVSVPFGSSDGMPVGVQIIGRRFDECGILGIGKALEEV